MDEGPDLLAEDHNKVMVRWTIYVWWGGGGALSAISQTQIDRPHPAYRCHGLSLQAVEFVIRSLNNLKTARHKLVNQSENGMPILVLG